MSMRLMVDAVVDGLCHCLHDTDPGQALKCEGCPYRANEETDWSYCCSHALRDDAKELLESALTQGEAVPLKPLAKWLAGYCVAPVPGKLGYPGIEENTHDWEAILRTMDWRTVEHDD